MFYEMKYKPINCYKNVEEPSSFSSFKNQQNRAFISPSTTTPSFESLSTFPPHIGEPAGIWLAEQQNKKAQKEKDDDRQSIFFWLPKFSQLSSVAQKWKVLWTLPLTSLYGYKYWKPGSQTLANFLKCVTSESKHVELKLGKESNAEE